MSYDKQVILGNTGLKVGRLGLAPSYGAGAYSFEMAFEQGCNYFYFGASRKKGMAKAVKNLSRKGKRDELVIAIQSFTRSSAHLELSVNSALKKLGQDHAEILILGWHNKRPSQRIIDRALALKEKGLIRFLGLSGHNRKLFPKITEDVFDMLHIRYNAVHRGAEKDIFPFLDKNKRPGIGVFTATCWAKLLNKKNFPESMSPLTSSDCYRFVLDNPYVDIAMTGPKNDHEMKEALKTLELGPLSDEEKERIISAGDLLYKKKRKFWF